MQFSMKQTMKKKPPEDLSTRVARLLASALLFPVIWPWLLYRWFFPNSSDPQQPRLRVFSPLRVCSPPPQADYGRLDRENGTSNGSHGPS